MPPAPPPSRSTLPPHARPALLLAVAVVALLRLFLRWLLQKRVRKVRKQPSLSSTLASVASLLAPQDVIAFFHPFTNDGGGGERVLWRVTGRGKTALFSRLTRCLRRCAVRAVQAAVPHARVVIYTGEPTSGAELAARAHELFGVPPLRAVTTVRLRCRTVVEARRYPVLTLAGQAAGSLLLGAEALVRLTPELFVDTSGYAFTYPLAAAAGARVACYVHYPMVSGDMLAAVASRAPAFNNASAVARSRLLSQAKLWYYRTLAALYGAAGRCSHASLVNSSWTGEHIAAVWGVEAALVHPPCDTAALRTLPLRRPPGPPTVLSVAQFRPEKGHVTQLRAWALVKQHPAMTSARLQLAGGVRGAEDASRLEGLRQLAAELGIADSVSFHVGLPAPQLRALLAVAHVGLHTMRDEHFGIAVVEYMAAGCVPVAHDSAGPREDIVVPWPPSPTAPRPGRLASTAEGFAEALTELLAMPVAQRESIAAAAREAAGRFSEDAFADGIVAALRAVLPRPPAEPRRRRRRDD